MKSSFYPILAVELFFLWEDSTKLSKLHSENTQVKKKL